MGDSRICERERVWLLRFWLYKASKCTSTAAGLGQKRSGQNVGVMTVAGHL